MNCIHCQTSAPENAQFCQNCGKKLVPPSSPVSPLHRDVKLPWRMVLPIAGAALALFFFTHHLVWKNGMPLPVRRVAMGFSEPMASFDEITSLPWIAAVSKYPLTIKALEQARMIESEQARQDRIQQEVNSKIQQNSRELLKQWGY